jgi:hypothetical protein
MKELVRLLSVVSDSLLDSIIVELEPLDDDDHPLFICKAFAARERRQRELVFDLEKQTRDES